MTSITTRTKRGCARLTPWLGLALLLGSTGCSEVRGRRLVKLGNELYRAGQYSEAVARFREAEQLVPDLPQLWLNKGYTCRQMLTPGAKTRESEAAVECALGAFQRLQALVPTDQRGPSLYAQTLFEAERFDELSKMYTERFAKNSRDEEALNGLVQVYTRWEGKQTEALRWYEKKAEVQTGDAEAQYAPAVFLWQQLSSKGGTPDKTEFDPRPDASKRGAAKKTPPVFAASDIVGEERVKLADRGIQHLERAIELRPKYAEAMTYLTLLYRQKAVAYLDRPAEWQKCIDKSVEWRDKLVALSGTPPAAPAGASSPKKDE
jgi:tetratricopeptide (TPR) repeat protein